MDYKKRQEMLEKLDEVDKLLKAELGLSSVHLSERNHLVEAREQLQRAITEILIAK